MSFLAVLIVILFFSSLNQTQDKVRIHMPSFRL